MLVVGYIDGSGVGFAHKPFSLSENSETDFARTRGELDKAEFWLGLWVCTPRCVQENYRGSPLRQNDR